MERVHRTWLSEGSKDERRQRDELLKRWGKDEGRGRTRKKDNKIKK
jgi:hypothetical protein